MEWHTIGTLEEGISKDEIAKTLAVAMLSFKVKSHIEGIERVL
jgi:alkylhydroperoxidase/carboxymuconolactone decarboxylase family protein YurZ